MNHKETICPTHAALVFEIICKYSKNSNTFLFLFSDKTSVFSAGAHEMLVRFNSKQ